MKKLVLFLSLIFISYSCEKSNFSSSSNLDTSLINSISKDESFIRAIDVFFNENYLVESINTGEIKFETWQKIKENPSLLNSLLTNEQQNKFFDFTTKLERNRQHVYLKYFNNLDSNKNDLFHKYFIEAYKLHEKSTLELRTGEPLDPCKGTPECCNNCNEDLDICFKHAKEDAWATWSVTTSIGLMSMPVTGGVSSIIGLVGGSVFGSFQWYIDQKQCKEIWSICAHRCNV
jgi:hypothetical protein